MNMRIKTDIKLIDKQIDQKHLELKKLRDRKRNLEEKLIKGKR
jgi:hypothetical protein